MKKNPLTVSFIIVGIALVVTGLVLATKMQTFPEQLSLRIVLYATASVISFMGGFIMTTIPTVALFKRHIENEFSEELGSFR